jgi:Glycosyl hydrolases family 39
MTSLPENKVVIAVALLTLLSAPLLSPGQNLPDRLIPRRSSQVKNGFGINTDLPRDPWIPWNRWWWTRIFDAGVNFVRIGQYENSSDYTSWDWVERKRGEYSVVPQLDDYVNSLVENGIHIEIQLLYGNPLYTSPSGRLPDSIMPEPGSFHNPDRSLYSVFWPPANEEQIAAFTRYVEWMVNHFRGRVEYYEIWNEPNIEYWNPKPDARRYGTLFKAAAAAVHRADPNAKAVFGGLSGSEVEFAKQAMDACQCASDIDVFAYHNYPGYGHNLNPEAVHTHADTNASSQPLREVVRAYPGIRRDIPFWDDEFNDGLASWDDGDETVQARYVPRGLITDWATGVRTFVWLLVGATDGNEMDDFGMLHGLMNKPEDFTARPVFYALQNTNALFSDTHPDSSIKVNISASALAETPATYAFRSSAGKAIITYWLPVLSKPGATVSSTASVRIDNSGIEDPVLVDVTSGKLTALNWQDGSNNVLNALPLSDSAAAIADRSFFDWVELPEAPSSLVVNWHGKSSLLKWQVHGGNPQSILIEARVGLNGTWQQISKSTASTNSFLDSPKRGSAQEIFYRVRASNDAGVSAYSNVAGATHY